MDVEKEATQMGLCLIVVALLCVSASIESFDDSLEHVSVNTGETATFICDLPERFSNKQVGILVLVHHLSLALDGTRRICTIETDYVFPHLGNILSMINCMF